MFSAGRGSLGWNLLQGLFLPDINCLYHIILLTNFKPDYWLGGANVEIY